MSRHPGNVTPLFEQYPSVIEQEQNDLATGIERVEAGAEIVSMEHIACEPKRNGNLHRYGFVTANGYAYSGTVTIPTNIESDIPILATGGWGTGPRGHNEHTSLKEMDDGIPAIFVGNEGSYRPARYPVPKRCMTLTDSAGAALSFSRAVAGDFNYLIDPNKRTALGESKGGMEGMGILALAESFDQTILMADFTAASIPKKPDARELLEMGIQWAQEPRELMKLTGSIAMRVLVHYPSTVDPHPYSVIHQLAKGPAIMSGEAGDLGRLVPKDQILHNTIFDDDTSSMADIWDDIFDGYLNVKNTRLPGSHLTLIDPETLAYIRARQKAFRACYAAAGNKLVDETGAQLVSGDDVFELAHELVKDYLPKPPEHTVNKIARFFFPRPPAKQAA